MARANRSPGLLAGCVLLAFTGVWLLECAATSLVPPVDNLEQLIWQHSLEWGYYKHPPLTTVLARVGVQVFGVNAWTTYLLGAAVTLAAMTLFWRLLRELRGPRYATIALLAALCITFYNGRLYYYNHNVLLMLLVAAAARACWQAHKQRSWGAWALVGVVFGLGALTKYQIAVTCASAAVFWIWQRGWRDRVDRGGALLALLIALVLVTPHLLWLPQHDFAPIGYAMESSLAARMGLAQSATEALLWTADALLNRALPAFLFLAALWAWRRRNIAVPAAPLDSARVLILSWGGVPLLFIPLVGVLFGAKLQLHWGTSFLLFVVPCVMELAPIRWDRVRIDIALKAFGAMQALLLSINFLTSPGGPQSLQQRHWRAFQGEEFASHIGPQASRELGGPVRIIIAPPAEGETLALHLPGDPLVLMDGRYDRSPWVTPQLVDACGALELVLSAVPLAGWTAVGAPFDSAYWRVIHPRQKNACPEAGQYRGASLQGPDSLRPAT